MESDKLYKVWENSNTISAEGTNTEADELIDDDAASITFEKPMNNLGQKLRCMSRKSYLTIFKTNF